MTAPLEWLSGGGTRIRRLTQSAPRWSRLCAVLLVSVVGCGPADTEPRRLVTTRSVIDFGVLRLGEQATQTLEIRLNRGPSAEILGIEAEGAWVSQYVFGLDGLWVTPDAPIRTTVQFVPHRVGSFTGLLRVRGQDVGLSDPIHIRGEGISEGIFAGRTLLTFSPVVAGGQREQTVDIQNIGSRVTTIRLEDNALVGPCTGSKPFCYVGVPGSLLPGGRQTLKIRYRSPSTTAKQEALLEVSSCTDGPECRLQIRLRAETVAEGLDCGSSLVFAPLGVGQCAEQVVRCVVPGDLDVEVVDVQLENIPSFEMSSVPPTYLTPGQSLDVPVQFCPTEAGVHAARVRLTTRTDGRPRREDIFMVRGEGADSSISVAPAVLDFGDVALGLSVVRSVRLRNEGRGPVDVIGVELAMPEALTAIEADPIALAPGETTDWLFSLRLLRPGDLLTTLRVQTNDALGATIVVPVRAHGVDLPPCDYAVPSRVDFGSVLMGQVALRTLFIHNQGIEDCIFEPLRLDDPSGTFRIVDAPASGRLPPGRWPVKVAFTPTTKGPDFARIDVRLSNPRRPETRVVLSGAGRDDALLVGQQHVALGPRPSGCRSPRQTVRLWNVSDDQAVVSRVGWSAAGSSNIEVEAPSVATSLDPGDGLTLSVRDDARFDGREGAELRVDVERGGERFTQIVDVVREVGAGLQADESFVQPTMERTDVLLVVDHAPAMAQELAELRRHAARLIDSARANNVDFQVGVTTTDALTESGRLLPLHRPPVERVVTNASAPSAEDALFSLLDARAPLSTGLSSRQGLDALDLALSPSRLYGENRALLRPEARLAVVFIAQHEDESMASVERYVDRIQGLKGAWRRVDVAVHAVVGDVGSGCTGALGSAPPAPRYAELAAAFAGQRQSICRPDWGALLDDLGEATVGPRRRLPLAQTPRSASTLRVTVDGVSLPAVAPSGDVNWTYDEGAQAVVLVSEGLAPGQRLRVRYAPLCADE